MQTFDEKEQNQQFLLIRKQMNENIIFYLKIAKSLI